jgi:hypothetical protein
MADASAVARLSDPTTTGMICDPLGATPQRVSIAAFAKAIKAASCSRRWGCSLQSCNAARTGAAMIGEGAV